VVVALIRINHPASYSDVRDGREIVASVSDKTSKGSFTAAFGVFFWGGPSKVLSHVCANNKPFSARFSNKFEIFRKSLVYSKFLLYLCSGIERKGKTTMKTVTYKTEEERLEALRKMVGMRKIFEARAREIYEQKYGISLAQ
jgi:hypothetical protein